VCTLSTGNGSCNDNGDRRRKRGRGGTRKEEGGGRGVGGRTE
jgi:hypothetical protein